MCRRRPRHGCQERADGRLRAGTRHAAFGRDAEAGGVAAGGADARPRALDTVLGMHHAEIQFGPLRERKLAERSMKRVVGALDRHRHVDVGELVPDRPGERIGEVHHRRRIFRLDEVVAREIAIAEMQAELDIVRHDSANPRHALQERRTRHLWIRHRAGLLAIPDHHLVAEVPLDAEILVRDVAGERRNLGQHGALVGGFDRRQRVLDHDRAHDRERRGQADLEADAGRQLATITRRHEVEIGGARFARIAQFAEAKR